MLHRFGDGAVRGIRVGNQDHSRRLRQTSLGPVIPSKFVHVNAWAPFRAEGSLKLSSVSLHYSLWALHRAPLASSGPDRSCSWSGPFHCVNETAAPLIGGKCLAPDMSDVTRTYVTHDNPRYWITLNKAEEVRGPNATNIIP